MPRPIVAVFAALLTLGLAAAAPTGRAPAPPVAVGFAPGNAGVQATAPLAPGSAATALDLLRAVYPDLTAEGRAKTLAPVRSVEGASFDPNQDRPAETDLSLAAATVAVVEDGTARYAAAMAGGVLVVAEITPKVRVVDTLFVQTDPGGPPSLAGAFMAAPGLPVAIVRNSHFNSQEGFDAYLLVGAVEGRLRPVFDGPSLYGVSMPADGCGWRRIVQRLKDVRIAPSTAGPARVTMQVVEETVCEREDGSMGPPKLRRFPIVLTWDARAKAYRGGSPALDAVNRERRGE